MATYYVKNSGSNSNTGLSDAQAWATISKVNSISLNAGDTVLFNKGDIWREQLIITSRSGTSGSWITIGSYGTGNKPKILGSVNADTVGYWTSLGSNLWASATNSFPLESAALYYDTNLTTAKCSTNKATQVLLTTNWDLFYDAINHRVIVYHSVGSPDTQANGIEIAKPFSATYNEGTVSVRWCLYLLIQDLDIRYSNSYGIKEAGGSGGTGAYNTFLNCEVHYTWDKGANLVYGDHIVVDHCIFDHCGYIGLCPAKRTAIGSWGESIWVQLITYPTIRYTEMAYPHNNGIDVWGCSNALVENCYCHDVDTLVSPGDWETGIYFDSTNDAIARNNIFENLVIGLSINAESSPDTANNIDCYNNIAINNDSNYQVYCNQGGTNHINNIKFYNNISYHDHAKQFDSGWWAGFYISNCTTVYVKNNIIYNQLSGSHYGIYVDSLTSAITSDYNDFYLAANAGNYNWRGTNYATLATWKTASSQDAHSITSNPTFTTLGSDWHLLFGSLAIGAGISVTEVTTDYAGDIITNPPSMGVYNYSTMATYYVKNSGNDSNTGLSDAQAWATITKVNTVWNAGTFAPNDQILFNRGDTFTGTLTVKESGTSGNPITIGAYGTGANPIFNGFTTITGWTNEGSGIYSKTIAVSNNMLNVVTVDGVNTPMGRYPKTGYSSYESHVGTTSITDNQLTNTPNWTGAQLVWRKMKWALERFNITNHTNSTITYTDNADGWTINNGYGYFIQSDLKTLTTLGDWYYNGSKFYMYFGAVDPTTKTVNIGTTSTLVRTSGYNYITIQNITFNGANDWGVWNTSGQNIIIKNCTFNFIGNSAITTDINSSNATLTIDGNQISNCNNNAILLLGSNTNGWIKNNIITNIGVIPGAGPMPCLDWDYDAITINGANSIVEYNTINRVGHNGISLRISNGQIARYNFIQNYGLVRYDGGGIYSWNGSAGLTDRIIDHNIVLYSNTLSEGIGGDTSLSLWGIYLDEYSQNATVTNNISAYSSSAGILSYNSINVSIIGNTCFDNGDQIELNRWGGQALTGYLMNNNIMFAKTSTQNTFHITDHEAATSQFATSNNNYFARPIAETTSILTTESFTDTPRTLAQWRTWSGEDAASNVCLGGTITNVSQLHFIYNETNISRNYILSATMKDVANTSYLGTITLAPWTSLVLIGTGTVTPIIGTYFIDPTGADSAGRSGANIAGQQFLTLAYAITRATSGDTIHVNAGTYALTSYVSLPVGISIEGEGPTTAPTSIFTFNQSAEWSYAFTLNSAAGTNGNQHISNIKMDGLNLAGWAAIQINGRSNVKVYNCTFINFYSQGVLFNGAAGYQESAPSPYPTGNEFHDNIVTNCAYWAMDATSDYGSGNLMIGGQSGMLIYNNTIIQTGRTYTSSADLNGYCIKHFSGGYNKGIKIYNNHLEVNPRNGQERSNHSWGFVLEQWKMMGGYEIYGNTIKGCLDLCDAVKGTYAFAVDIHNNEIGYDTQPPGLDTEGDVCIRFESKFDRSNIYNNHFKNTMAAIYASCGSSFTLRDLYVYYNIFENLGNNLSGHGWALRFNTYTANDLSNTVTNWNFWNNVIIGGASNSTASGIQLPHGVASNFSIRNNIIENFDQGPVQLPQYGTATSISIENNVFYNNGNSNNPTGGISYTNANNLKVNPLFVSATDFHLQAGSPAINTGISVGLTTDYAGVTIANPPEIGAYEYTAITTYYIDPAGADSAGRSGANIAGQQFLTLAYAISRAVSGNIIHVNPGTYILTSQVVLPTGISIEGDGITSIIKSNVSTTDTATILLDSGSQGTNGNQHISNISMNGNTLTGQMAIRVNRRSNVIIHDCKFIDFMHNAIYLQGGTFGSEPTTYATGNQIYNCDIDNCAGYYSSNGYGNIDFSGQDGLLLHDNNINQTTRTGLNGYCTKAVGGYNRGCKIYNNTLIKAEEYPAPFYIIMEFWNTTGGIEIYNNNITGGYIDCGGNFGTKGSYNYTYDIHNNTFSLQGYPSGGYWVHGVGIEGAQSDLIIRNNSFTNFNIPICITQNGSLVIQRIYIYYNIFKNMSSSTGGNAGVYFYNTSASASNAYIYILNNVFYNGTVPTAAAGVRIQTACPNTNIFIENNIFQGMNDGGYVWLQSGSVTGLTVQNNIAYSNANSNNPLNTVTPASYTYVAAIKSLPSFVTPGTDFHLQAGSPAINAGVHITTPVITTDYAGNTIASPPEIGVYEYTGTSILVTSITVSGAAGATTISTYQGTLQMSATVLPANATNSTVTWSVIAGTGTASISATGLLTAMTNGNVTVRATANDGSGVTGNLVITLSNQIIVPTVTTTAITAITNITATSGGNVTSAGNGTVSARGVCWNTSINPTTANSYTSNGTGTGSFTSSLTGLTAGTTYYVRAYATNEAGTSYGSNVTFVTTSLVTNIVVTGAGGATTISTYQGTLQMSVTITPSNATNPTVTWSVIAGTGTASINSTGLLTALTNGNVTVRATANDGSGIIGNLVITLSNQIIVPTVTTTAITAIAFTTATSGGNITSAGNGTVSARGVCWSTSINPTAANSHTTDGTGIGSFTSSLTGLTVGTTYYVRAYATNQIGTSYGSNLVFTTLIPVTNITVTGAGSATTITSYHGTLQMSAVITPSNATNPAITWSVIAGSGTASINSSGLLTATSNGTVTVVATANDGSGVTGNLVITLSNQVPVIPILTTTAISTITFTTATSGGNISSAGNGTVSARGICWSTSTNPTTANSHTTDGTGIGSFTSYLTGLIAATTYYVRAYATNEAGTAYGSNVSFTTLIPVTNITVTGAGSATTITTLGGTLQMSATVLPANATNPAITWSVVAGSGTAAISSSGLLTAITNGTVTVRAAANDGSGITGNLVITLSNQTITLSTVTTTVITAITFTTATGGGNITSAGNGSISTRGICWSTNTNPTITNSHTSDGTGVTPYTSYLTGLSSGTAYYVRAYATNEAGTAYGANVTFTTLRPVTSITVSGTDGATTITTYRGTLQMIATVLPANATNPAVTWSVINGTGSAIISSTGRLTAIRRGNVTVRATSKDGTAIYGDRVITISYHIIKRLVRVGHKIVDINEDPVSISF